MPEPNKNLLTSVYISVVMGEIPDSISLYNVSGIFNSLATSFSIGLLPGNNYFVHDTVLFWQITKQWSMYPAGGGCNYNSRRSAKAAG